MRYSILFFLCSFTFRFAQVATTENINSTPSEILEVDDYFLETGIYYLDKGVEEKIFPSSIHDIRLKDNLFFVLSLGLIPVTSKAFIIHSTSNTKIKEQEFIFSFNNANADVMTNNFESQWFRTASSPNEFLLLKLNSREKRRIRDFTISTGNIFFQNDGINPKKTVQFSVEFLGNGKYKVIPSITLEAGEYCFIYQSPTPLDTGYQNQLVFDFTVE